MNKTVVRFMREQIKKGLDKLEDKHRLFFKRMYSQAIMSKSINDIIDNMPEQKLDWALTQIENTLKEEKEGE